MTIASDELALQEIDEKGLDVVKSKRELLDDYLYAGKRAHIDMEACSFTVTDRLEGSYITTAALRRSDCHPHLPMAEEDALTKENVEMMQQLRQIPHLHEWIKAHSTLMQGCQVQIDQEKVLHPFKGNAVVQGQRFTVIPSNEMRVIMGYKMVRTVDTQLARDESPLQGGDEQGLSAELAESLENLNSKVNQNEEIQQGTKDEVT